VYARILDRLIGAGAKVVAFDLLFPTPAEHDEVFRAALEKYRDRVVVGSNFTSAQLNRVEGGLTAAITLPSDSLIPQAGEQDDRVGFVNFWPDADGVIRSTKFQTNFGEFLEGNESIGESNYPSLAAQIARRLGQGEKVPKDTEPRALRFTSGTFQRFRPHSVFEIFVPEYWERNYGSGAAFKDAVVVVGASGNWQHDEHQTPFGLMSGPEIQLNALNALLSGAFIAPAGTALRWTIWIVAGLLAGALGLWHSRPLHRLGILVLAATGWCAAQKLLFDHASLTAPTVGPALVLVIVGLIGLVFDLIVAGAEQFRLRVALVERKRAQEMLEAANAQLEQRVAERTSELTKANSDLTGLLSEKDVLLKEIHHRVKNNLQVISSLLNLQSNLIEDDAMREVFAESRNRVRSMALIHEKLYQSEDLSRVDFEDYLRALTNGLQSTLGGRASSVRIAVDVESIKLSVDSAVPCGLIVNELVTNCFKYAFKGREGGEIRIGLKRADAARLSLTVADDGIGFPKTVDFRNTESLGMQIVTTLTEQLDGSISLRNGVGTTFEINFPETTHSNS
jgi:two-component sensor histidine kinase/CHASE2 domain-containing sensor protein